jgi:hypothetical protein
MAKQLAATFRFRPPRRGRLSSAMLPCVLFHRAERLPDPAVQLPPQVAVRRLLEPGGEFGQVLAAGDGDHEAARPENGARASTPDCIPRRRAAASRAGQDCGGDHGWTA